MRNKTLYVLLFAITFSIKHDTFISLLHLHDNIQTSKYADGIHMTEKVIDIQEIHSMFHFLAVVSEKIVFSDTSHPNDIASRYTLLHSSLHKERAQKPPIA